MLGPTLKSMLKSVGEDGLEDWNELLPWLLFAYREVRVEGLGFSPFDLVFGRDVKGTLKLIKKSWLREDIVDTLKSECHRFCTLPAGKD